MDSPSSSVESSPNAPRRFLPVHILNKLSPSKHVIPVVSDSYCDSDEESLPLPTSYYTSPSRPEKRRHLTIPSPKMAQLSIKGPPCQFMSSILGYGQCTKKTLRLTAASLNHSESTSAAASQHAFSSLRMQGAIPVSDPTFINLPRGPTEGRWKQRLFLGPPQQPDGLDHGTQAVSYTQ